MKVMSCPSSVLIENAPIVCVIRPNSYSAREALLDLNESSRVVFP